MAVDATGLSSQLAEELTEHFGEEEVEQVSFTADVKADLATRVFGWIRNGRVRFERNEAGRLLHAETIAVRRKVTAAGNVLSVSPRSAAGHGDRFWSMALALRAADRPEFLPRDVGHDPLLAVA